MNNLTVYEAYHRHMLPEVAQEYDCVWFELNRVGKGDAACFEITLGEEHNPITVCCFKFLTL